MTEIPKDQELAELRRQRVNHVQTITTLIERLNEGRDVTDNVINTAQILATTQRRIEQLERDRS